MEQNHIPQNDIKKKGIQRRIFRIIGFVIGGVILAGIFALVLGVVVQWLWNWLMPDIFGLNPISYWQAFGLLFLTKLLFGGLGHRHPSHHRKKWVDCDHADPWKHYNRFWREKGNEATDELIGRTQTEK